MESDNKKTVFMISGIFAAASFAVAIILQMSMEYFCSLSDAPASLEYSLSKARDFLVILFGLTFSTFVFLAFRKKFSLITSIFSTVIADALFFLIGSIYMYVSIIGEPISISTTLIAYASIIAGMASLALLFSSSVILALIKLIIYIKSKITQN